MNNFKNIIFFLTNIITIHCSNTQKSLNHTPCKENHFIHKFKKQMAEYKNTIYKHELYSSALEKYDLTKKYTKKIIYKASKDKELFFIGMLCGFLGCCLLGQKKTTTIKDFLLIGPEIIFDTIKTTKNIIFTIGKSSFVLTSGLLSITNKSMNLILSSGKIILIGCKIIHYPLIAGTIGIKIFGDKIEEKITKKTTLRRVVFEFCNQHTPKGAKLLKRKLLLMWGEFFLFEENVTARLACFSINRTGVIFTERHFFRNVFRVLLNIVSEPCWVALDIFAGAYQTNFYNCAFFSHFYYLHVLEFRSSP